MFPGNRTSLARDYELPKRPVFILDDWDIVQGADSAAYVSSGVMDGVMYGTNGRVGVRHRGEGETIGFHTSVFMNGVYHSVPLDTCIDSQTLPEEMQVGATICDVNLNCLIDGDSGTLRVLPSQRLSLRDATYHSYCSDVMSGDGGLIFDGRYCRVVSLTELDLWGASIDFSDFSFNSSPGETPLNESPTFSRFTSQLGSGQYGEGSTSYSVELLVKIMVDLCNWTLLRGDSVDDFVLQSRTSGLIVNTVTESSCVVEYSNRSCKIISNEEILSDPDENMNSPYDRPFSTVACFSDGECAHGIGNQGASCGAKRPSRHIAFRKFFPLTITPDNVPEKITLSFFARHNIGRSVPYPRLFPPFSDIVAEQRRVLDPLWEKFHIDVQHQGELTPNRMRLALLYNAFRLFCVSHNLRHGLPRSGCSSTGENLQYDLQQYLYHGIFYTYTSPSHALALIRSLYSLLPQARVNAHKLSLGHGAVFPRSTITGTECHYRSTVNDTRLHVNAVIGYIINLYFIGVKNIENCDRLWLLELMLETARVWPQLGEWVENEGVFRLDNIAGPDEYNGSASGNFYIHLSAKMHLRHALELYKEHLEIIEKEALVILLKEIDMDVSELENFQKVSDGIVIVRNDNFGVYMEHDHFHTLTEWKGERAKHPLSMNYHPLAIFRHKLVDIPEVLLGMFLYQDEFDRRDFERNLAYYKPLCTYDSPESLALVALMELYSKRSFANAMPLLRSLMSLDLDNIIYTADEGLDFAAMSASWIALVCGIGGLSLAQHKLHLNPCFPAGLSLVRFSLCWRGAILRTTIDAQNITYDLISGDSIRFVHGNGHRIHLHPGSRSCSAKTQASIPRLMSSIHGEFEGAIFLCEALFDESMDIHFMAWYKTLESLFENHRALHQREIPPITAAEYVAKVIYQAEQRGIAFSGIHNVLLERGLDLELGSPDDAEIVETRYGLANAKVAEVADTVSREMPRVNSAMRALMKDLSASGIALAIVTYTRSLKALMQYNPDVASLMLAHIDGEEAYDRRIKGRPHVDIFLRAAEKIHVDPSRCLVFSIHLDRGYKASTLARFRMFFDVEERFVVTHMSQRLQPYPTLTASEAATAGRAEGPLVLRMPRANIPTTIDALEDVLYEQGSNIAIHSSCEVGNASLQQ